MDNNKKIAFLLRSVANVFETDIECKIKNELLEATIGFIGVNELIDKKDTKAEALLRKEDERAKTIKDALHLIRKMDENDTIKAYKDKLIKADPSYKRTLTDIDKVRGYIIEEHIKEYKFGLDENVIPSLKDYKLPGGKSLDKILKDSKLVLDRTQAIARN